MKWVTRERPKIDRIACPWLVGLTRQDLRKMWVKIRGRRGGKT